MTLAEHLDDIRIGLRGGVFTSEASVSQNIVFRLLQALDWPSFSPQVIVPEYSVGGRVDFALCHPPLKPLVFIEVKPVGQITVAEERHLYEYAFRRGVPITILTDGREWHFFRSGGQGNYQERRVFKLDLIDTENEEISTRLNRYLSYESMRTGAAVRSITEDYRNISRQRQIETRLPEAWKQLVEREDEFLIEVVAEQVRSLCGHRPTSEQVLSFFRSLRVERSSQPPVPIVSDLPPPIQPGSLGFAAGRRPPTRLDVVMPNGERINHPVAIRTFAEVIEKIGIDRVRTVYPGLISTSQSRQHGYQVGHHYYIKHQTSTRDKKRILERIAERLRIQLEVRIIPRN